MRLRYADGAIAVDQGDPRRSGLPLRRQGHRHGPGLQRARWAPACAIPTEAERGSRYVMPASAVGATVERAEDRVAPKRRRSRTPGRSPRRASPASRTTTSSRSSSRTRRATARLFTFSLPRPEGKPSAELATGVGAQGTLRGVGLLRPEGRRRSSRATASGLERTVDFGWYGILARPLLWLLKKTHGYVGNWGVAILVVTFLIRLLLFPLTAKSYASMKKMQKLAPKMNAIRDKYKKAKTDAAQRQKMNAGADDALPGGGLQPDERVPADRCCSCRSSSRSTTCSRARSSCATRPFVLLDQGPLGDRRHATSCVILMIVSMYVQQAMTPSTMDPAQKKIFMFMPVLWGFFLKDMPSGLVLYWLFSNLLTIVQQLVMNRIVKEDDPAPPREGRQGAQAGARLRSTGRRDDAIRRQDRSRKPSRAARQGARQARPRSCRYRVDPGREVVLGRPRRRDRSRGWGSARDARRAWRAGARSP